MKNFKLSIVLLCIGFFGVVKATEELSPAAKLALGTAAHATALTAYSAKIGIAQLTGDKDNEKRLQFCLWETQNFITALKKAKTDDERNAVIKQFDVQMMACYQVISAW